ncbi:hypothetical protein NQ318_009765 [Aromia moschata]|uniref:Uncharacterized protein n=1 Tax=Aromia moschata TaxID=1265417 RepID=A0AAV8Y7K2_9CUCU|nr:hypothetical protein NQ318_009765 [Aromia moschata]
MVCTDYFTYNAVFTLMRSCYAPRLKVLTDYLNEHMIEVKQSIESIEENRKTEKKTKLTAAEQKREQELQRKLEKIKENEKRAETVRQNKANIIANKMTPSSGRLGKSRNGTGIDRLRGISSRVPADLSERETN